MKKPMLLTIFALLLTVCLASCGQNGNSADENSGNPDENSPSIYGSDTDSRIIIRSGEDAEVLKIADRLNLLTGRTPKVSNDSADAQEHEIVIGDTTRPISEKALLYLERAIEDNTADDDSDFLVYFSVYSDGRSIALVWSDDSYKNRAVDYLLENYFTEEKLELKKGYSKVFSYSPLEEMRDVEALEREKAYAKITAQYGEGVTDALKAHYALYDERFYLWLADLYDPGEYDKDGNPLGGGFYYSNSARDTVGYLVDIESTNQALSFLVSSGMLRGYGNDYKKAIPEKMQKEMVAFALSLQSPVDGYFYHPQWGTSISAGRLSRDMGNSVSLLSRFGYKPYYNTPGGAAGSLGNPPGASPASLTEKLSEKSSVSAVSKVISSASSFWPERLKTLENWKEYIDGFESGMETKSYSIGHNVAEQSAQIKNREAEAKAHGEPTGYIEYVQKFFDRHQNPENGLWEDNVSYNSVNGLMKIMAIYNGLSLPLNYAEKAYNSAVEIIKLEGKDVNGKEASNSVDVYNAWCSLTRINTNINNFGSKETVATLRENLLRDAEEMIRITTAKTAKFIKDDGSYGYTWNYSPAKSQGASAAVPNTIEGDINGGTIALTAVTGHMMDALGISGLYIYYPSDFEVFIRRAASHSQVVKDELKIFPLEYDFEDDEVGTTTPSGIGTTLTNGSVEIAKCLGTDGNTNALRLTTVTDKGDSFYIQPRTTGSEIKNRYILEWDMKFEEIGGNYSVAMQIKLGNMYMLTLKLTKDGTLSFGDSSSTGSNPLTTVFNGSFDASAWHRVRIEHYPCDGAPITKIFVDQTLLAESSNYQGKESASPAEPAYTSASFYALFATNFVGYFDNITLDTDAQKYVGDFSEEIPEEYKGEFDFEDSELGEPNLDGLATTQSPESGNSILIGKESEASDNKVLRLTAKTSTKAGNWIKLSAPDTDEGIYVFEADICAEVLNRTGDIAQIFFRNTKGLTVFALNMKFIKENGGHKLTFQEKNKDESAKAIFLTVNEVISGWFTLRVEYDPATCIATVTVNGTHSGTTGAYYSEENKSDAFGGVDFFTTFSTDATLIFDNISVKK